MWVLNNDTPFAAERTLLCDKNGADVWIVAVKGTFIINPDSSIAIADEQAEVFLEPKYIGKPGESSLLYDSDLILNKPTTDVILQGHAHSEDWVTQIDVTMRIANFSKTLRIFGNRYWDKGVFGLKVSEIEPFKKMPLVYEKAFGGIDQLSDNPKKHDWEPRNPVGTGFAVEAEHLIYQQLPNIEDPKKLISSWKHRPQPKGFGPVRSDWSPRVKFAGTYDEQWEKERFPLLPEDFNDRFYQCAPEDQQTPKYLMGGETVELHNLSPNGLIRFNLPQVTLNFNTKLAGQMTAHQGNLHTVILEPDVPRVIMVWHTQLPCHGKKLKLEWTDIGLEDMQLM